MKFKHMLSDLRNNKNNKKVEAQVVTGAARVRGLTHRLQYFDEQTSILRLKRGFMVIRLGERVDLGSELQVTDGRTRREGAYRVVWTSPCPEEGMSFLGLELLDPKTDIWKPGSVAEISGKEHPVPMGLLECRQCEQRISTPLPQVGSEYLTEGFTVIRQCDTCKAETGWTYCGEAPGVAEAPSLEQATPPVEAAALARATADHPAATSNEQRQEARVPLGLPIKIIRDKVGQPVYDRSVTVNVSRTGISFTTEQEYEPGETVQVIMPDHPDSMKLPLPAKVVRSQKSDGTAQKRVAVRFIAAAMPKAA